MKVNRVVYFLFCLLTLTIIGCNEKTIQQPKAPSFDQFEISYTNGWTESFSYIISAEKIYHTQDPPMLFYGILPDSIFDPLDSIAQQTIHQSKYKSRENECMDCPVIAIDIIKGRDTLRIDQSGDIDSTLQKLVDQLTLFGQVSKPDSLDGFMTFTTHRIFPPPPAPPWVAPIQFTVPEEGFEESGFGA